MSTANSLAVALIIFFRGIFPAAAGDLPAGPPVLFSQTSGTFQGSIFLSLATTNHDAAIYYTTDGTLPTDAASLYSGSLTITNAVQIRARAFAPGLQPGPPHSETFIPLTAQVAAFKSDLPVMIIHDFNHGRPPAGVDTFAAIQIFEPGPDGLTSLVGTPALATRSFVAERGSSTAGYPKVSLKVQLEDEFDMEQNLPVLGLPKESDWVLYAPDNFEPILIHNPFAHQLSRDIGRYSPRTRFVEVYLVQNGFGPVAPSSYNGIYVLEEKIKLGKHRVDAPKLAPGQNSPPEVTGGYLMKIDRPDPGDSGFNPGHQTVLYVDPKESNILQPDRAGQHSYLTGFMTAFDRNVYSAGFADPATGYRSYIDTGAAIDHHLLNILTFNVDALRLSAFFYKQRNGKLHFGPLWDFDRSLNSTDGRDANPRVWRSQVGDRGTDYFNFSWWGRLFKDPDFFQQYIDRYQELRHSVFSTTNLWRLTDQLTSEVHNAQPREQARWGVVPRGGYQGEINRLKTWLSNRVDFMDSQFVTPPSLPLPPPVVPSGFSVSISVPANATIYYTLDGADPRLAGTASGTNLSPSARRYDGPIVLAQNARIVARSWDPAHTALTGLNNPPLKSFWSGPVSQTYVVHPFSLLPTEIMYHPKGDGPASSYGSSDFEFVELKNTSDTVVDLAGFHLAGTVDFDFTATNAIRVLAPQERLILVSNPAAFQSRYPNASNVAGAFRGNLGNDGGQLALFGPLAEPVFDFRYSNQWQFKTDGGGYSLVINNEALPAADLSLASSWTASANGGGSPGTIDTASSTPLLISTEAAPGQVKIRFAGLPAVLYVLQSRASLITGQWQDVQTVPAPSNGVLEFNQPAIATSRFYRLAKP